MSTALARCDESSATSDHLLRGVQIQRALAGGRDVRQHDARLKTVVQVDGYCDRERLDAPVPSAAVATVAAGDKVLRVVASALRIRLQVIERQPDILLDSGSAPHASHPIAHVDGQTLGRTDPVHSLILLSAVRAK